jgi:hypothetical protein
MLSDSELRQSLLLADELFALDQNRHLSDLESSIIAGVLNKKSNSCIARESHCTEGHVRDTSSRLWRSLSKVLGETVNRKNLHSALLRRGVFNFNLCGATNHGVVGVVNTSNRIQQASSLNAEFLKGKQSAMQEIALRMKCMNFEPSKIAEALNISLDEVIEILKVS